MALVCKPLTYLAHDFHLASKRKRKKNSTDLLVATSTFGRWRFTTACSGQNILIQTDVIAMREFKGHMCIFTHEIYNLLEL